MCKRCSTKIIDKDVLKIHDAFNKSSIIKKCIYIEICPASTEWCKGHQPSKVCIPFLENTENILTSKINTIEAIKDYINRE